MIFVQELTLFDIEQMIEDDKSGANPIRPQDKDELFAFNGMHPYEVLRSGGYLQGEAVSVVDSNGYVLVIFGVVPADDYKVGWLIGTERGQARGKELHRLHRKYLKAETETVKAFTIHLDLDKWHKALGFEPAFLWETPEGMKFKEYVRTSSWAH